MEKDKVRTRFASNIRIRRKMAGLTLQALGSACGYPENCAKRTAARWEREEGFPDISRLPLLAKALRCSIDDLFR